MCRTNDQCPIHVRDTEFRLPLFQCCTSVASVSIIVCSFVRLAPVSSDFFSDNTVLKPTKIKPKKNIMTIKAGLVHVTSLYTCSHAMILVLF